jgi:hypothetical protein
MASHFEAQPQHVDRLERASGQKIDLCRFVYFVGPVEANAS